MFTVESMFPTRRLIRKMDSTDRKLVQDFILDELDGCEGPRAVRSFKILEGKGLCRYRVKRQRLSLQTKVLPLGRITHLEVWVWKNGAPDGIRTRVSASKGLNDWPLHYWSL